MSPLYSFGIAKYARFGQGLRRLLLPGGPLVGPFSPAGPPRASRGAPVGPFAGPLPTVAGLQGPRYDTDSYDQLPYVKIL